MLEAWKERVCANHILIINHIQKLYGNQLHFETK